MTRRMERGPLARPSPRVSPGAIWRALPAVAIELSNGYAADGAVVGAIEVKAVDCEDP